MSAPRIRLATRGSPLALEQTRLVEDALGAVRPGAELERVVLRTEGDRRAHEELDRIGGQGLFVKEVQVAVLEGRADVGVHSAKDLPPRTPAGLVLACVLERADPRDAMVGAALGALAPGALVATGSARRRAQLASVRPDLLFVGLRGNMATRLAHAGRDVDAVVAAAAALDRLGWGDRAAERLPIAACLPQVGQGAIALECRAEDGRTRDALDAADVAPAHRALEAERAYLAALGAGCTLPVAAWAEPLDAAGGRLRLHGMLASGDGRVLVRSRQEGDEPLALGRALARALVGARGGASIEGWEQLGPGPGGGFRP